MLKQLRITGLILFLMTILWVILMGISTADIEPVWSPGDYVEWASQPSFSYRLNYINVSLLTLGVVIFFALLYKVLNQKSKGIALAGLVFVPIYGMMNLICYSLQISFVPSMAQSALGHPESIQSAAQWIQANPDSIAGFVNGLAYALLAVPSLIFGYLLILDARRLSGLTLMLSGFLCLLGITGMILNSRILSMGIMAGGFIFLISLGCIVVEFRERADSV